MIYEWIHEIFTTFFIDPAVLPLDFQPLLYFVELWAVLLFFRACLSPLVALFNFLGKLSRDIIGKQEEWRPEWTRKQKRSLRNEEED
jgi:hypothetical protein